MSFVWNSYRRLALLRHLAGVFPNVYKRSRCVKMSPRTEFPFNETARRHLVNGAIRQRLVTFRRRFREAHKNEKALKVIFRGTGKKKNTFCWLSVCALRDDWLIYNVVIFYFLFFGQRHLQHHCGLLKIMHITKAVSRTSKKDKLNTSTIKHVPIWRCNRTIDTKKKNTLAK